VIFLDASVLLAAEDLDDTHHAAAADVLAGGSLATLDLAAYEVTNVAERAWGDGDAGKRLRDRVWAIAELGTLVRADAALLDRAAELAREHELSAYDAAYLAGAQRVGSTLVSCDERDLVSKGLAQSPASALADR
jgi:predicted nucleic acid-binding protein